MKKSKILKATPVLRTEDGEPVRLVIVEWEDDDNGARTYGCHSSRGTNIIMSSDIFQTEEEAVDELYSILEDEPREWIDLVPEEVEDLKRVSGEITFLQFGGLSAPTDDISVTLLLRSPSDEEREKLTRLLGQAKPVKSISNQGGTITVEFHCEGRKL